MRENLAMEAIAAFRFCTVHAVHRVVYTYTMCIVFQKVDHQMMVITFSKPNRFSIFYRWKDLIVNKICIIHPTTKLSPSAGGPLWDIVYIVKSLAILVSPSAVVAVGDEEFAVLFSVFTDASRAVDPPRRPAQGCRR